MIVSISVTICLLVYIIFPDPDIFISRSNDLAQKLRVAKQEKERILGAECDNTIPRTRELMETLETLPEFLPAFDGEIFADLVDGITVDAGNTLRFRLKMDWY